MTSKEALNDLKKRNNALKKEGHFHIGTKVISVLEELVEKVSALEEENKLLKDFVGEVDGYYLDSHNAVEAIKKKKEYKNIDWGY